MDEYDKGMDPEVKRYFRRIINSFSVGLMWLMIVVLLGLSVGLGVIRKELRWYNIAYYLFFIISFIALLYFLYRVWRRDFKKQ